MFNYLLGRHQIHLTLPGRVHDYSLVVIFDTGDMKRSPLAKELARRDPRKTRVLNIDHHPTVTDFEGGETVDLNFIDLRASATTEMVYKILEAMRIPLDAHAATSLLTGILTDTGHFTNLGTTLESLEIAAKLMAKGAQHRTITQATMRNKSLGTLQLWGRALTRLNHNKRTGVVSTVITLQDLRDCGVDSESATGIGNFLNNLSEGKIALVLMEEPDGMVKGSFRTTSDVNVAELAKKFGGGGHPKAAGFKIPGRLVFNGKGWKLVPTTETNQTPHPKK